MALPPDQPWIQDALRAHAAESPRWQYVFGRFDARELGGQVLSRRSDELVARGYRWVTGTDAAILVGDSDYRPTALGALRHGTARAALAGGLVALKRLNQTTAAYQRLCWQHPERPLQIAHRLGAPEAVATLLSTWLPSCDGARLLTSRFDEVIAYEGAGLELVGQEGVAQAFTVWLLANPAS